MPGPPPPPPPPGMGGLKAPKSGGSGDDRGQLLQSIRLGAKLKKTVTVDKSGPCILGKENTSSGSSSSGPVGNGTGAKGPSTAMNGGPPGLGGLFAGGMPKLRPTGMGVGPGKIGGNAAATPKSPANSAPIPKSASSTLPRKFNQSPEKSKSPSPSLHQQPKSKSPSPQIEQTRVPVGPSVSQLSQVLGQALMKGNEPPKPPEPRGMRAPPPQPPPAPNRSNLSLNSSSETTVVTSVLSSLHSLTTAESKSTTILANPPSPNISSLQPNRSSLHGTNNFASGSSLSLNKNNPSPSPTFLHHSSSSEISDNSNAPGKVINYGKPNVAPKPPGIMSPNGQINGSTPQSPKKQPGLNGRHASRSQSVRVPRSPPVTPPCPPSGEFGNNGFAPLKVNAFHQSQDSIDRKQLPGMAKNIAPPPPPPMSGSRTLGRAPVRPPAHCPPPPPPARPLNQPPPPPPHRQPTPGQHTRSNSTPSTGPPQPPVRNSSMRSSELDNRFNDKFRMVDKFPAPDMFRRIEKTYSSVHGAVAAINNNIVNKQQAPMPPITHIQLTPKLWANNSSNC